MTELINDNTSNHPSKYASAIRYGLIAGFILTFLTTINFLYMLKVGYIPFMVMGFIMFIVPVVFYIIAAQKQKKLNGGVLSMKDAFQNIFIVILISSLISSIYGILYNAFIDPEGVNRMKEAMVAYFESLNMPDSKIDEVISNVDKATQSAKSASKMLMGFAQGIIFQSILGFIVALIIKKDYKTNA